MERINLKPHFPTESRRAPAIGLLKVLTAGFLALLIALVRQAEAAPSNHRILIIHSYHSGLSWTDSVMNGVRDTFARSGVDDIQVGAEYLDARRYTAPEQARRIQEGIISKLEGTNPGLVIVSDNAAFDFVLAERNRLFPDAAIVFCGINGFTPAMVENHHRITGVTEDISAVETIELAKRLHPGAKEIIVIGRTSVAADKANRDSFTAALHGQPARLKVTFWDDLPLSELRARLKALENNSIVFLNGLITDETGRQLMYGEATKWVSRHSRVPVYSLWDVYLGYGIVGGKLISAYRQGRLAGEMALRILNGDSADRLPVVSAREANQYMFDFRQLEKWGIPLAKLPENALFVNRPESFYHKYQRLVWTIVTIVSVLSASVVLLGAAVIRRRRAEDALKKAILVVENSPAMLFRRKAEEGWPVVFVSENVTQLGYLSEQLLDGSIRFASIIHPDDLERVGREVHAHSASGTGHFQQEYRIVTKHGSVRWVDDRTVLERDTEGRITHYQGVLVDITDRKQAENLARARHRLSMRLASASSLHEALSSCFDVMLDISGMDCGAVYNVNPKTGDFELISSTGLCESFLTEVSQLPADHPSARLALAGSPVYATCATLGSSLDLLQKEGLRAIAIVPVCHQGKVIACYNIASHTLDEIPATVQELLEAVVPEMENAITRILAEQALREKTEEIHRYFTNSLDLLCIADTTGRFIRLNPEWERVLGFPLSELEGKLFVDFVHPDDLESTLEAAERMRSKQDVPRFVNRFRHKDGTYRWLEWNSYPSGNLIDSVARDITERKQAEEDLQKLSRLQSVILDNSPVGIAFTHNRIIGWVNRRVLEMFGISIEQCHGASSRILYADDETYEQLGSELYPLLAQGKNASFEVETRRGDGSLFWCRFEGKALDASNLGEGVIWTVEDITERKRERESLLKTQFAMDKARDSILWVDDEGRIVYANDSACTSMAYSRDELLTLTVFDIDQGFPRSQWEQHKKDMQQHGTMLFEGCHIAKDGRIFPVEVSSSYFEFAGRWLACAFDRDITERKQAQEALQKISRMQSVILENSPVGISFVKNRVFEWVNSRMLEVYGIPGEHIQGASTRIVFPSDEAYQKLGEESYPLLTRGKKASFELEMRRGDGSLFWCQLEGKALDPSNLGEGVIWTVQDITERKRAEEALQESEQRFRAVVENAPAIISITDENGIIRLSEGLALGRLGRAPGQTVGKSAFELYKDAPGVMEGLGLALEGKTHRSSDVFGEVVLETVYSPYFAPDGRKSGVISIALDTTERVRAEAAARENEEKLAVALEGADLGSWNWDVQSGEISFDERWAGMLGYRIDEIEPHVKSWEALVHPDDLPRALETLNDHLEGRTPFYETEHRLRHKSGVWVWVLDRGRVVDRDADGRPIRAAGTHLNISERKRAEEALEKRLVALTRPLDSAEDIVLEDLFDLADLQRLQDLFADAFGVAALMTTPDGKLILHPSNFSELCLNIIRKTPKGLENCNYSDAMIGRHNPSGPNIQPCLSVGLCNAGASITVGGRHIANWLIGQVRNEAQKEEEIMKYAREIGVDEETFRAAYRKVPVMSQAQFDKTARILFEMASQISRTAYQNVQQARFITERKQAEEALRKYERIVSTSLDLMALINRHYIYEAVNESMLKALDKPRREVVGRMVPECIGEKVFREKVQPRMDQALSGQVVHFQETLDFAGIGRRILDIRYIPFFDETGEVGGVVMNARDITDRRKLEEQLLHAQKIESIGTLAGGVAHEINNPINGIMNYAQLILDGTEEESPAMIYAKEIVHETERIAKIVRNLLTFARDERQSHSTALLSDIVSSVLSLIQTVMRRDQIVLQLEIPDDLPEIKCRSQQIQQVLMNLMTNARDALNERFSGYSDKKRLALRAELIEKQGRRFIRTTVEDAGKGIPLEILDRIFDPFFTTKPKEIGTGLGLSISYGIVKDHGGDLSVESEPGRYTRFHMDLPVDNA